MKPKLLTQAAVLLGMPGLPIGFPNLVGTRDDNGALKTPSAVGATKSACHWVPPPERKPNIPPPSINCTFQCAHPWTHLTVKLSPDAPWKHAANAPPPRRVTVPWKSAPSRDIVMLLSDRPPITVS